ncbi:MAG: response regulator [Acetatifactor sp.]|nr:response regulator [Acetatifactor sp.]
MRDTVLIVDDTQLNRILLRGVLAEDFKVLEAENGKEAFEIIEKSKDDIAALLLDLVMPEMDGEELLSTLHKKGYGDEFPILIVTAEQSLDRVEKCFDYGIADFIRKPFKPGLVKKRVKRIVDIYSQKNDFKDKLGRQTATLQSQYRLLQSQAEQLKQNNEKILDVVGTIAEYRNMESGGHIRNVKKYTEILANHVMNEYPQYGLTPEKVRIIVSASALHDIGKIVIPDHVLLKPGKLTNEEYELMCSHTLRGYEIIERITGAWNEEYAQYSKEIARHHHERYDGRGYAEGLSGEAIPISAQIVAVADCFDALLTDKIYRAAFSFDEAYPMILNGECGVFSPKLMESFRNARTELEEYYRFLKREEAEKENVTT